MVVWHVISFNVMRYVHLRIYIDTALAVFVNPSLWVYVRYLIVQRDYPNIPRWIVTLACGDSPCWNILNGPCECKISVKRGHPIYMWVWINTY